MIKELKTSSYEEKLKKSGTVQFRKERGMGKMIKVYKIICRAEKGE